MPADTATLNHVIGKGNPSCWR